MPRCASRVRTPPQSRAPGGVFWPRDSNDPTTPGLFVFPPPRPGGYHPGMKTELNQAPLETPPRQPSNSEMLAFAIVVFACFLNMLAVPFSSWDYNTFGLLGFTWFWFGSGFFVWQVVTRRFSWSLVLLTFAISAFAVFVNLEMVARITASV